VTKPSRQPVDVATQVAVLYRSNWLCHWCGRPVIFAPALKYLGQFVESRGFSGSLAYYDVRYRRDASPLLDELGLAIDHVEAYSKGGEHGEANFVAACSRCNALKGDRSAAEFAADHPKRTVRSTHGEPKRWDGLASYFIVVGRANEGALTAQERKWLHALEAHLANQSGGEVPPLDRGGSIAERLTDWSADTIKITPPGGAPAA
jgi:hypothetical protein